MIQFTMLLFSIFIVYTAGYAVDDEGALPIPVHTADADITTEQIFNPNHPVWAKAKSHPLLFHRTPPLYADGPFDDGERPEAVVTFLQSNDQTIFLRMEWKDETDNRFSDGKRYPDGGAEHIYKKHTEHTDMFGDAACLMIPKSKQPVSSYPSMMMGDQGNPVDLLFWQAGRGFSVLQAHGRASTAETPSELTGKGVRTNEGWVVIIQIPKLQDSTPVCFALWDGEKQQRDGLKYFSLWYEVKF